MPNIYLLKPSQLLNSNLEKSILAFVKETGKPQQDILSIYKEQSCRHGIIYKFKTDTLTTDNFITKLNIVLQQELGIILDKEQLITCWNAMCTIDDTTKEKLENLISLQKKYEFIIHIVAESNPLHAHYFTNLLETLGLKCSYTSSYSGTGIGKLKEKLRKQAIEDVIEKYHPTTIQDLLCLSSLETIIDNIKQIEDIQPHKQLSDVNKTQENCEQQYYTPRMRS